MSCNSCSNITLPGVVGPAGAPGAAGAAGNGIVSVSFQSTTNPGGTPAVAGYTDTYRITYTDAPTFDYDIVNGTNGTNGTVILYQDTTIQSPTSLGTSYSDVIGASAIPITGIGNVGDQIRVEMTVIGDIVEKEDAYVNYFMQVTFGGLDVYFDVLIGRSLARDIFNGTKMIFDLVVTAANTLKVRTLYAIPLFGVRTYQYATDQDTTASYPAHFVNPFSTINPTLNPLSGSNDLKVRLKKSSAGIGTEQCSVTSMTVYRMLKEQ